MPKQSPSKQTTSKKVKVVGTQLFLDTTTGELVPMQVQEIEERDFNFSKVWMRSFIAALDIVGNKKTRLCYWIIDNINRDNLLIGTLRQIAEKSAMSLETVRVTINILLDADFLRRVSQSVYMVNPNVLYKGSRNGRLDVLSRYMSSEKVELSDAQRLKNLEQSIKEMQAEYKALSEKLRAQTAPGQQHLQELISAAG